MLYLGGVLSGTQKIGFTCSDPDAEQVKKHTLAAWEQARKTDARAAYFVTPIQGNNSPIPG